MKKTRPELRPSLTGRPGFATLVLTGWESESIEIGARAEVCVQRNQDQRYLGEGRQWTASQTWHQVSLSDEPTAESVMLSLEPVVVDPLVENPQMTYQIQIRIGSEQGVGVIRIREGVLSSHAAGQTASPVAHVSQAAVEPIAPEPAPLELAPAPEPVVASENKKSKLPLIALLILLLLVGVGWFAWMQLKTEPVTIAVLEPQVTEPVPTTPNPVVAEAPTSAPIETPIAAAPVPAPVVVPPTAPVAVPPPAPAAPPAPVEPPACSAEAMAKVKDDLIFIQSCLKTNPDSVQVLSVIDAAKKSKRCDLAQRLYAFKGQAGDIPVALAYAKEFDPASFAAGCFKAADKETAIYWYEVVVSKDANHAEAKSRLGALRK